MLANPFIELFERPVATLVALGYACLLATLLVWTLGLCWQNVHTVRAQYRKNWARWNYVPPLAWIARVSAIPLILWIDAWAVATLIWLVF